MKTLMAGPEGVFQPGQVVEVDAKTAQALLSGGFAEAVKGAPVETAVVETAERAVTVDAPARTRRKG